MFRTECICCRSTEVVEIVNLGMHPLADTFVPAERLDQSDHVYPLICDFCPRCRQVQLRTVTDPDERYVHYDYSYTSSNSQTSRNHWTDYAKNVANFCGTATGSTVVEIGSNDGFLLDQLQKAGFQVLGVDPSPAMAELARERGIATDVKLFSLECAEAIRSRLAEKPALIIGNNVFNHANDPIDFARGIKSLLAKDGTFVFELPYWLRSVSQRKFDQIYHEHVSYFTVSYARNLFAEVGMQLVHAEEVDYHGGSIRVFVRHDADSRTDGTVNELIGREERAGLFRPETYRLFMKDIFAARNSFLSDLYRMKSAGEAVVCVGAAAKGNTFLNFYNLDHTVVDYVTDSSPSKIGKFTPNTRIPIQNDDVLRKYDAVNVILLSWNLAPVLEKKLRELNARINLLNPYADEA